MALSEDIRKEIIKDHKISANDTGSCEVQVALLTENIEQLTQGHFKLHPKDKHSLRGLQQMVSTRKKLLKYLKRKKIETYKELVRKLGLRR